MLHLAPELDVEFVDREPALKNLREKLNAIEEISPSGSRRDGGMGKRGRLFYSRSWASMWYTSISWKENSSSSCASRTKKRLLELVREMTDEAWARAVWAAVD